MKKYIYFGTICFLLVVCGCTDTKKAEAYSQKDLVEKVKSRTSDAVEQVYEADYDHDGRQEAFIITKKSKYDQTLWFSGDQEVKKIATSMIWVDKASQGICRVSSKQKIFVAEGSGGGSGSWSYCCYVKNGKAILVKRAGEGLAHHSGNNFSIHQSAFDGMYDGTDKFYLGHTWKAYYLRWTGTKFVEYEGREISREQLGQYKGADKYIREAEKLGYRIGKIFYRKNGIINVNVSKKDAKGGDIDYDNFTLNVKGKNVSLRICNKKGKNILEKSGFEGIYKAKGFPRGCAIPDWVFKG